MTRIARDDKNEIDERALSFALPEVLWLLFTGTGRLHMLSLCHYREVCCECSHKPPAIALATLFSHLRCLPSPSRHRQVSPHPGSK